MYKLGLPLALLAACAEPASDTVETREFAPTAFTEATARRGSTSGASFELRTSVTGTRLEVTVLGAAPNSRVQLLTADAVGDGGCTPGGACLALTGDLRSLGTVRTDARGRGAAVFVGRRFAGQELAFQAVRAGQVSNPTRVRVPDGNARLRATHASPDAPAVDVYADGALVIEDLDWAETSGWLPIPAGAYTIDLRAAGASPASDPVYTAEINAEPDGVYTAVAAGRLAPTGSDDALRLELFTHDFDGPRANEFRAIVTHAATTAPTVAVDVGNDGSLDLSAVPVWGRTGAEGLALPANRSLAVGIKLPDGTPVTQFTIPGLGTGEEALVVATGFLADAPETDRNFGLLAILRDGTTVFVEPDPVVYALHASPGAPAVDVRAGGQNLTTDLAYGEVSAPIQVPPGSYPLQIVAPLGDTELDVGTFPTPELAAGNRYLVVASGLVGGDPAFQLLPIAAAFTGSDDEASVQFVHASPDTPAVDVGLAGPPFTPVRFDVGFGGADAGSIDLPAGTYDLAAGIAGAGEAALTFTGLGLSAGDRYFAVAAGLLGDDSFQLMLVDARTSTWTVTAVDPD